MHGHFADIVGKTVTSVVTSTANRTSPRSQVFLVFSDGTYFEIYSSDQMSGTNGVSEGGIDAVMKSVNQMCGIVEKY